MKSYEIDRVKIYNFMKRNNLSKTELSKLIGRCPTYISYIMGNRSRISEKTLEDLATIMEVDEEELIAKPGTPFMGDLHTSSMAPEFEKKMEEALLGNDAERAEFFGSQEFIDSLKSQKETGVNSVSEVAEGDDQESINLAEYAKRRNISAQTASLSFRRYQEQLTGLYARSGRNVFLSKEGVEKLDSLRASQRNAGGKVNQQAPAGSDKRIVALVDLLSKAFLSGQKTIRTVDLMKILLT